MLTLAPWEEWSLDLSTTDVLTFWLWDRCVHYAGIARDV